MKKFHFLPRFLALSLSLSMSLPSHAWALRTGQAGEKQSGMEELEAALRSDKPADRLMQLATAVLTPAVSTPSVHPESFGNLRAGLVEGRTVPLAAAGVEELESAASEDRKSTRNSSH